MGRDVLFTNIFQERAVTMGLADGTYSVLEDTVTSLLKKEGQTLQFNWLVQVDQVEGRPLEVSAHEGRGADHSQTQHNGHHRPCFHLDCVPTTYVPCPNIDSDY